MARILIVDDSPSQLVSLKRIVEKLGHQTITAEDGAAGVEVAKREVPDLILMDFFGPASCRNQPGPTRVRCSLWQYEQQPGYRDVRRQPRLYSARYVIVNRCRTPSEGLWNTTPL